MFRCCWRRGKHLRKHRRCPCFCCRPGNQSRRGCLKGKKEEENDPALGGRERGRPDYIYQSNGNPFTAVQNQRASRMQTAHCLFPKLIGPSYRRAEKPEDGPPNGLPLPNGFPATAPEKWEKGRREAGRDAISPGCYEKRRKGREKSVLLRAHNSSLSFENGIGERRPLLRNRRPRSKSNQNTWGARDVAVVVMHIRTGSSVIRHHHIPGDWWWCVHPTVTDVRFRHYSGGQLVAAVNFDLERPVPMGNNRQKETAICHASSTSKQKRKRTQKFSAVAALPRW